MFGAPQYGKTSREYEDEISRLKDMIVNGHQPNRTSPFDMFGNWTCPACNQTEKRGVGHECPYQKKSKPKAKPQG